MDTLVCIPYAKWRLVSKVEDDTKYQIFNVCVADDPTSDIVSTTVDRIIDMRADCEGCVDKVFTDPWVDRLNDGGSLVKSKAHRIYLISFLRMIVQINTLIAAYYHT